MQIKTIRTRLFIEGENVFEFICAHVQHIPDNSVLVVTSKIVALAENRTALVKTIEEKENWIIKESDYAVKTKYVWMTLKEGMIMASAGIDESNANGKLVLLPKNSYTTAKALQQKISQHFKLKNLGILITDSRVMPFRTGTTAVAMGYAGFAGLRDYRGKKDLFGRVLKFSQTNVADSLATAAVVEMGEGSECQPLALITELGKTVQFQKKSDRKKMYVDPSEDMYLPLIKHHFPQRKK